MANTNLVDPKSHVDHPREVGTGTVTASGGSSPAVTTTLQNVALTQTSAHDFLVYVDADPSFNATYAWNFDYGFRWDNANSQVDINLTVNWDTDPGSGNDVTLRWKLLEYEK